MVMHVSTKDANLAVVQMQRRIAENRHYVLQRRTRVDGRRRRHVSARERERDGGERVGENEKKERDKKNEQSGRVSERVE